MAFPLIEISFAEWVVSSAKSAYKEHGDNWHQKALADIVSEFEKYNVPVDEGIKAARKVQAEMEATTCDCGDVECSVPSHAGYEHRLFAQRYGSMDVG